MADSFIDLQIEGMTCAGCVARVVKAVEKIPHARAEVSLLEHRARVFGTDLDAAVAAIRRAGYAASPWAASPTSAAVSASPAVSAAAAHSPTEAETSRPPLSTLVSIVALGVLSIEMVAMILGSSGAETMTMTMGAAGQGGPSGHGPVPLVIQALLASLMQLWVGAPIARAGMRAVTHGRASMATLILLGTGTAYLWSMAVWVLGYSSPVYFEASVVVIAMLHIGQRLQARAQARTLAALAPFLEEPAVTASRLQAADSSDSPQKADQPGAMAAVASASLRAGDQIWVAPGERLVCDGRILDGATEFDEAGLTGESQPAARGVGDRVTGGAINLVAPVVVQVEGNPEDWRQARLRDQMRSALASRAPIAAWADRVAAVFVPLVAILAATNLLGQSLWGPGFVVALERTIALLVIACPCALGLATPMAVATGLARAAQRGWLFSTATSLQKAAELTHLVFDKTGTLTEGRPRLVGIASPGTASRPIRADDFPGWLAMATAAQDGNPHPIAGAFWSQAAGRPMPSVLGNPEVFLGQGVAATTSVGHVVVGRPEWVEAQRATSEGPVSGDASDPWPGASQIDVAVDGRWAGRLWAADTLKPDAAGAVALLRSQGLGISLLSGDREAAVGPVARALGLEEQSVAAGQQPEDKARGLQRLQEAGEKVGMVGDGLNDLAAMGQADLAIALSAGASLTLKTADVTLTNSQRLQAVPEMLDFARRVKRRIIENLVFAFGFNLVALPLAAFGILPPALAGAAMAVSSLAVVSNALRLLRA